MDTKFEGNKVLGVNWSLFSLSRLFMQLKIRQVSMKDQGVYRCVITFANKTVRTTAKLTVHQEKSTKVTRIEGKCVNYEQGRCIGYIRVERNTGVKSTNPEKFHVLNYSFKNSPSPKIITDCWKNLVITRLPPSYSFVVFIQKIQKCS